jgi:hypothetical protein
MSFYGCQGELSDLFLLVTRRLDARKELQDLHTPCQGVRECVNIYIVFVKMHVRFQQKQRFPFLARLPVLADVQLASNRHHFSCAVWQERRVSVFSRSRDPLS